MGYIEGESQAQRTANGPWVPHETAELVKKICDAMMEHSLLQRVQTVPFGSGQFPQVN